LQKIIESVESVIEIEVKNIYKSSILNESEQSHIKTQLIGTYTEKLMKMICERWSASEESKILQEMGYNVEIVPLEKQIDENYILLTREIL
jgi:hypothetical protein